MPSPGTDTAFDAWKFRNAPRDSGYDYDLYRQFKDLNGADVSKDGRGHGTDMYKRPNHSTFSDQSIYSNSETPGGKWAADGSTFTPSDFMLKDKQRMDALRIYMSKYEPDTTLIAGSSGRNVGMEQFASQFQKATQLPPTPPAPQLTQQTAYGYPVVSAMQSGMSDYLKANPHVAGMAIGGGLNGTPESEPRSIVVNPHNPMMFLPENRDGLLQIEAARHKMAETSYSPNFQITPQMQAYRESTFKDSDPYLKNDPAFKQSLVSRSMVGDLPFPMPEVDSAASAFQNQYFPRPNPYSTNPSQ